MAKRGRPLGSKNKRGPGRPKGSKNKVKAVKVDGRGRPPVYVGRRKQYIVSLVRQFGAMGAASILNASTTDTVDSFVGTDAEKAEAVAKSHERAKARNQEYVPADKPLGISLPTLSKLANRAGVKLARGRRALDAKAA